MTVFSKYKQPDTFSLLLLDKKPTEGHPTLLSGEFKQDCIIFGGHVHTQVFPKHSQIKSQTVVFP